MAARRSVWANPEVQELSRRFIPAADEVGRLQRGDDPECLLFQQIAEQGHYAGRSEPTPTRQGIYAFTASGRFLASVNTRRPEAIVSMLKAALAAWEELPAEQQGPPAELLEQGAEVRRLERHAPEGGLVLRVVSRDLPRWSSLAGGTPPGESGPSDWRTQAWNLDQAWFSATEARLFLPAEIVPGAPHTPPSDLVERLVRFHLIDNVRGQTSGFPGSAVGPVELTVTVRECTGALVTIDLAGRAEADEEGVWSVDGWRREPTLQRRGMAIRLCGRAVYDLAAGRFVRFQLVAAGHRWGGSRYNARSDDLEPAPIAFVLEREPSGLRVAPACYWSYRSQ